MRDSRTSRSPRSSFLTAVDAFRDGTAPPPLSWEPEGRAADNRAVYLTYLGNEWLPAIPDLDRRLLLPPFGHTPE